MAISTTSTPRTCRRARSVWPAVCARRASLTNRASSPASGSPPTMWWRSTRPTTIPMRPPCSSPRTPTVWRVRWTCSRSAIAPASAPPSARSTACALRSLSMRNTRRSPQARSTRSSPLGSAVCAKPAMCRRRSPIAGRISSRRRDCGRSPRARCTAGSPTAISSSPAPRSRRSPIGRRCRSTTLHAIWRGFSPSSMRRTATPSSRRTGASWATVSTI